MKKKLILCALAAVSSYSLAGPGAYIGANIGIAGLGSISITPGISAGYDFGNNIRAGVDYAYLHNIASQKVNVQTNQGEASITAQANSHFGGVSVSYDIEQKVIPAIKPYLGARLGLIYVTAETKTSLNGTEKPNADNTASASVFAAGFFGGFGYPINNQVTLDASLGYTGVPGLNVGVRYKF